jgi:hypothetical protein
MSRDAARHRIRCRRWGRRDRQRFGRARLGWPHKDGKGLNIQLVPGIAVSGRLVLREYTDEDVKIDEGKRKPAKK